jgi:hypothetical protein
LDTVTSTSEAAFTQSAETGSPTMAIEAYKHAPLPDQLFQQVNPAKPLPITRQSSVSSLDRQIDTGTRGA